MGGNQQGKSCGKGRCMVFSVLAAGRLTPRRERGNRAGVAHVSQPEGAYSLQDGGVVPLWHFSRSGKLWFGT
jgi:hypothetical protein